MLIPRVLERLDPPPGVSVPVVLDSPHSGSDYPEDFRHCQPHSSVRRSEDAFVDELFADGPARGAPMLRALFPRSYVDPNRAPDDIDEAMLDGPWSGGANPGPKVALGIGLIPKFEPGGALYDRMLGVEEVRRRIDRYWRPYHDTLAAMLDEVHARHGAVWHLDCHSMPAVSNDLSEEGPGHVRPDFCIGDRDGTTCDPALTDLIVGHLRGAGFSVGVNDPYKGVELVRRYSDPPRARHSVQIEVSRALYMDEARIERNAGFEDTRRAIDGLLDAVCGFASRRSSTRG